MIETEHKIVRLLKYLPAGSTESGGNRDRALVQFIAEDGGKRTVACEDLVYIR